MRKKLCLLLALVLPLTSVGCVEKIRARMEIKQANQAYEKEDYPTALQHYKRARDIDSEFPELDRMIGYSQIGLYVPDDSGIRDRGFYRPALRLIEADLSELGADVLIGVEAMAGCKFVYDRQTDSFSLEW